jgi:hypothetical protein
MERYNALTESSGDQLIISPVPRLHNLNYRIASFPYILLIIQFWPSLLNLVITRIDLTRLELSGIIQFREYRIIKISVNTVDIVGEGEREREREREWEGGSGREKKPCTAKQPFTSRLRGNVPLCLQIFLRGYRPPLRAPRHEFPAVSRDERARCLTSARR